MNISDGNRICRGNLGRQRRLHGRPLGLFVTWRFFPLHAQRSSQISEIRVFLSIWTPRSLEQFSQPSTPVYLLRKPRTIISLGAINFNRLSGLFRKVSVSTDKHLNSFAIYIIYNTAVYPFKTWNDYNSIKTIITSLLKIRATCKHDHYSREWSNFHNKSSSHATRWIAYRPTGTR